MTLDQQIRFVQTMRALWASCGLRQSAQMAGAIIASLRRLEKFERRK